jgi:hypothetical protein
MIHDHVLPRDHISPRGRRFWQGKFLACTLWPTAVQRDFSAHEWANMELQIKKLFVGGLSRSRCSARQLQGRLRTARWRSRTATMRRRCGSGIHGKPRERHPASPARSDVCQRPGMPQNYAKAVVWLRKAAEQGEANGQSVLGVMYAYGIGARWAVLRFYRGVIHGMRIHRNLLSTRGFTQRHYGAKPTSPRASCHIKTVRYARSAQSSSRDFWRHRQKARMLAESGPRSRQTSQLAGRAVLPGCPAERIVGRDADDERRQRGKIGRVHYLSVLDSKQARPWRFSS